MTVGLPVSRIVNVSVNLTPVGAQFASFNTHLLMGDSNVINVKDRIRSYNSLSEVASDFGTSAAEYLAADIYFSQSPTPTSLYIGRWAKTATAGLLIGGVLSPAQQVLSLWTTITTGAFKIAVDGGSATQVSSLNFGSDTSLTGVAGTIQTAVQALGGSFAAVTCTWNGEQFTFTSGTTGAASAVAALTSPTSGVDISAQLLGTATLLEETVAGIAAESALTAVTVMDQNAIQWYMLSFGVPANDIVDADCLAIAGYIQGDGTNNPHLFGWTTAESAALSTSDSTSIGYQLRILGYTRTLVQWSLSSLYAVESIFGRMNTVDFTQNNSTITLMFQNEPGVVAENLTPTQANALNTNNYNYFAQFNNNTVILVNGITSGGQFIDTVWGCDWLANQIQTDVYNVLITATTKVPQTDAGVHLLTTACEAALNAGVNNGLLAPGQWNAPGFGQIYDGFYLSKGYYVYAPPIATQAENLRAERIAPPIQIAAKLAGAIQSVNITVNVNL